MNKVIFSFGLLLFSPLAISSSADGKVKEFLAMAFWAALALLAVYVWFQKRLKGAIRAGIEQRKTEVEEYERQQRAESDRARTAMMVELNEKRGLIESMQKAFSQSYIGGRHWLAEFVADSFAAYDDARAKSLEVKSRPAMKSAEEVRRIGLEKRELIRQNKLLEYTLKTYHEYYPTLEQYSEDVLNERATLALEEDGYESVDTVSSYISTEEFNALSVSQRNQRALDNWKRRPKSSVEIGRMYERYIGYLYEEAGWTVEYFGATQGLEDLGRDLICSTETDIHIVQAKYWSQHRTIHEKHIFQLYGTAVVYPHERADVNGRPVTPVFATTTSISETARWAAQRLSVELRDDEMDHDYPLIKCNINGREKIYHLPFDQQYDRVKIDFSAGERYVETVDEAERLGYRRAMRHRS